MSLAASIANINKLIPAVKAAQIAGKIAETKDLTEAQADTLGTILYGFLPEGASLKATATEDEIETFLLAAEAAYGPNLALVHAAQALFEPPAPTV